LIYFKFEIDDCTTQASESVPGGKRTSILQERLLLRVQSAVYGSQNFTDREILADISARTNILANLTCPKDCLYCLPDP
jgi:hypothetical protein